MVTAPQNVTAAVLFFFWALNMKCGYALPKGMKRLVFADPSLRPDQKYKILATAALLIRCGVATGNTVSEDDVAPDNTPCDTRMLRAIDDSGFALQYLCGNLGLTRTKHALHIEGDYRKSFSYRYSFIDCPSISFRSRFSHDPVWMLLEKAEKVRVKIDRGAKQYGYDVVVSTDGPSWEVEHAKFLHVVIDPSFTPREKLIALRFNEMDYRVRDLRGQNGRIYTSITQLPKRLRAALRFGSRRLATIDITSAFLTFAAIIVKQPEALDGLQHLKAVIERFFKRTGVEYTAAEIKEFRQRMVMDSLRGIKTKFYRYLRSEGMGAIVDMLTEFHNRTRIRAKELKTKNACVIEQTLGKVEAQFFDALMSWAQDHGVVMFRIHDCVMVLEDDLHLVYEHMMGLGQALWGVDLGLESPVHAKTYPTVSCADHRIKEFMSGYKLSPLSHYVGDWWMTATLQVMDRKRRSREFMVLAGRRLQTG